MSLGRMWDLKRVATAALLVGAVAGGTACASGGGGGGGGNNSGPPNEITREQIAGDHGLTTAIDLIRRLRPRWLTTSRTRTLGSTSAGIEPVVMLDGLRFGDLSSLGQINLNNVIRMTYLSATDATTLYGTGYMGGAIQVFTR